MVAFFHSQHYASWKNTREWMMVSARRPQPCSGGGEGAFCGISLLSVSWLERLSVADSTASAPPTVRTIPSPFSVSQLGMSKGAGLILLVEGGSIASYRVLG